MRAIHVCASIVLGAILGTTLGGCGGEPARRPAAAPDKTAKDKGAAPDAKPAEKPGEPAPAEGWGTIRGRFKYAGTPPTPAAITPTKDQEVCGKFDLVDESLVVSSDGGLANVVVFLRSKPREIHPDYDAMKGTEVVLDNEHCRFDPHVVGMWTEQKLKLTNSDPIGHNTKADLINNESFNVLLGAGASEDRRLTANETLPMPVACNIHPWMGGYLLVRQDPYFAVSANDGTFEIKNLPAGELELQLWQQKAGNLRNVQFGQAAANERGRVNLVLKPGETLDVGEIVVDEALFKR